VTTPIDVNTSEFTPLTDPNNAVMTIIPTEDEVIEEITEDELAAVGDTFTSGMIALIPTAANAERLYAGEDDFGELPEDLHTTVIYLGDITSMDERTFSTIVDELVNIADEELGPVVAEGFNVALFNPHTDERDTCVTLGLSGSTLHLLCKKIRDRIIKKIAGESYQIPEQHEPWIPHVTLAYTEDYSTVERLADRTGDITFDRVRLALGDDVYDFDLRDTFKPVDLADVEDDADYEELSDGELFGELFAGAAVSEIDRDSTMEYNDREGEVMNVTDTVEEAAEVEVSESEPGAWSGVLIVEGVESGDGRMFAEGSLKSAPLPLPLMWQKQTATGHETAVQAGRIDEVWREGNQIWGRGVFDLEGDDGYEAYRQVAQGFLRGVSGDVDSVKDSDVELVFPKSGGAESAEGADGFGDLFAAPELTIFHRGRLRGATLVQFPAFVEASIALDGQTLDTDETAIEEGPHSEFADDDATELAIESAGESVDAEDEEEIGHLARRAELTACGCTDEAPPTDWFEDPKLSGPTPLTVTEDGRIFGHAAVWGTCHTGFSGTCVTPPRERLHEYFLLGETLTADGSTVATGSITLGTGHAATGGKLTALQAIDHYDHTGTVVADVATGEDKHGLWFSGALRPKLSPYKLRALRAAKLSGDWRRFGNGLRLIALLAVNVPGFPVPRVKAGARRGVQTSLVAAGVNPYGPGDQQSAVEQEALQAIVASLKQRIGRDDKSRLDEIRKRIGR